MKYVPMLMSMDGELNALKYQDFSNVIMPFIQIVKDIKVKDGKASVLSDIEAIINLKQSVDFFITVPRNLDLSSKKLKKPVNTFFKQIGEDSSYHSKILNRFSKYPNVIPVIEVDLERYEPDYLLRLKESVPSASKKYGFRVDAKTLDTISEELWGLITKDDYLIYDLKDLSFDKNSIKKEIKEIQNMQAVKGFTSVVIKQIYKDLTFAKYPDGLIKPKTDAYDCIDFDFYDDFKVQKFNYFGDWAGIRNNPIYAGGASYPSYLTIEMDSFNHHGFKGIEMDINSYKSIVLKKYLKSIHWTALITAFHKSSCYGCKTINNFSLGVGNPNSATRWKSIIISHFIDTMEHKINNTIV